jgi:hypothetical protein
MVGPACGPLSSFGSPDLDELGTVAFGAVLRLADGRSGIARADPLVAVPAPVSLWLLAVGVAAAG